MGFFDEIGSKAKDALKKAGEALDDVVDKGSTEVAIFKVKREISLVESEIKGVRAEIGRIFFEGYRKSPDSVTDPEMVGLCKKIVDYERQINEYEQEILKIREEAEAREREEEKARAVEAGESGTSAQGCAEPTTGSSSSGDKGRSQGA